MKREEAFHHHSQLRRSPRRSSVSSSTKFISRPGSTPDANAAALWALSLHVLEPQPLEVLVPYLEDNDSLRRSSRFTINKYRSPIEERSSSRKQNLLPAVDLSQLRKSPRFSSSSSTPALTSGNVKVVNLSQLRRSPRFSSPSSSAPALTSGNVEIVKRCRSMGKEADEGPVLKKGRVDFDDRSFRRLSACEKGNSECELLALPEPGSGSLSEGNLSTKCLRSRTSVMLVGNDKDIVEKSGSKKTNGDDFNMNEKCLRSRKIKCPLIESPRSSENKSLERCQRKSPWLDPALIEPSLVQKSASVEKRLKSRDVPVNVGKEIKDEKKSLKRSGDLQSQVNEYDLIGWPLASDNSSVKSGLRTSPRFNKDVSGESLKLEMLSLPDIPSTNKTPSFIENSLLKTRTVEIQDVMENCAPTESNSPEIRPDLIELSDIFKNMDTNECDSEVINEKCLRCRKSQLKVDANESSSMGEKLVQIELHGSKNEPSAVKNVMLEKNVRNLKIIVCTFVGEPIPEEEAQKRWRWRYELKSQRKGQGGCKLK